MRVEMVMRPDALRFILVALMSGVDVEVITGRNVRDTMRELEITDEECRTLVRTVFLDGRPVDDFDASTVPAGASLALGAAMPGLVGAVLRSGSPISVFREDISAGTGKTALPSPGWITLKAFNMVAEALMPRLLARGIRLKAAQLEQLLAAAPEFQAVLSSIRADDSTIELETLLSFLRQHPDADIRLLAHA